MATYTSTPLPLPLPKVDYLKLRLIIVHFVTYLPIIRECLRDFCKLSSNFVLLLATLVRLFVIIILFFSSGKVEKYRKISYILPKNTVIIGQKCCKSIDNKADKSRKTSNFLENTLLLQTKKITTKKAEYFIFSQRWLNTPAIKVGPKV